MVAAFLFILINTAICWLAGSAVLRLAGGMETLRRGDGWLLAILCGLAIWSGLLLALSLVFPLNPWVCLIAAGAVAGASWSILRRDPDACISVPRNWLAWWLAGLVLAAAASTAGSVRPIIWYDTGNYHHLATRMMADHGTIPGQALLEIRLGFSTQWFALVAPWDHGVMRGRATGLTGQFVRTLLLLMAGMGIFRAVLGRARLSDWFLLFMPVVLHNVFALHYRTPSPDPAVALMATGVLWVLLLLGEEESTTARRPLGVALLLMGGGAMALKASGAIVAAVAGLWYAWEHRRKPLAVLGGAAIGLAVTLPMIAQNVIASGYLLFPYGMLAIPTSWTIPEETRIYLESIIALNPRGSDPAAQSATQLEWLRGWWRQVDRIGFAYTVMTVIAGVALFAGRRLLPRGWWWVVATAIGGLVLYLAVSPAHRFVAVPMLALPVLVLAAGCRRFPRLGLGAVLILGVAAFSLRHALTMFQVVFVAMLAVMLWQSWFERSAGITVTEMKGWRLPRWAALAVAVPLGAAGLYGERPGTVLMEVPIGHWREWVVVPPPMHQPEPGTEIRRMRINDWEVYETIDPATAAEYPFHDLPWDAPFPATRWVWDPNTWLLDPDRGPAAGWRLGPSDKATPRRDREVSD